MNYKLTIEYDGTHFHGWQIQPKQTSIQGVLERALGRLLGEAVNLRAAGRTDAGVHALGQVANFFSEKAFDPETLCRGLNALAAPFVAVRAITQVADTFDARRDARSRVYQYRIWNESWVSPFHARYSWHWRTPLDVDAMERAAECLVGEKDFSSFQAAGCDAHHPVRRVLSNEIRKKDGLVLYTIEATAFLRHMVRNLVGTLCMVGLKGLTPQQFQGILEQCDRTRAGVTAPARGLFLMDVKY